MLTVDRKDHHALHASPSAPETAIANSTAGDGAARFSQTESACTQLASGTSTRVAT